MSTQRTGALRSIFDGFEEHRTATDEDYGRVLTRVLLVPDANVLLNFYRYNQETRAVLFAILKKIREQLWVPHQVLSEFWRNRESAIRDRRVIGDNTISSLEGRYQQSVEDLRAWGNGIALPADNLAVMRETLERAFRNVIEKISARRDSAPPVLATRSTHGDPVLDELDAVIESHRGDPMDVDAYEKAIKEGHCRVFEGIPPAYKDKKKEGDLAVGGYLV